jgi:hypothetical protein
MINQRISIREASAADLSVSDNTSAVKGSPEATHRPLTKLGEYLTSRSVNKAIVARKTGLSKQRMGELSLNNDAKPRAYEVKLIALAIGVSPSELFEYVCAGVKLKEQI